MLLWRKPWPRRLVALLIPLMVLQGCSLFAKDYPAPPTPLRPSIVGMVVRESQDTAGYHTLLTDGRTIDQPNNGTYKVMGGVNLPGYLFLAGETTGGFSIGLEPIGGGCWEAYKAPSEDLIVWDMGDSILFTSGLELPKAPSFSAEVAAHDVDGRQAWTQVSDPGLPVSPRSFCVNEQGQVVSATLYPVSSGH
jgi:hypothetical protein